MKALSLWQPWASLIAWGEKQYETRGWWTPYRGPLAIHAAKSRDCWDVFEVNSFYRDAMVRVGLSKGFDDLPFGAVLCVVDLVDVVTTESLKGKITQIEEQFGDHSSGRYAWKMENVRVLKYPITYRGSQGFWDWPVALESLEFVKEGMQRDESSP